MVGRGHYLLGTNDLPCRRRPFGRTVTSLVVSGLGVSRIDCSIVVSSRGPCDIYRSFVSESARLIAT